MEPTAAEAARSTLPPPPLPAPPLPAVDSIPTELRPLRRWVCWQYRIKEGKPRKVPLQPDSRNAKVNDPSTWSTLDQAHEAARRNGWGVGIVLGEVEPGRYLVGVDLDDAYEEGAITPRAARMLAELQSYTEFSPSGKGVHIVAWSAEPPAVLKEGGVEIYCDARYFTWTANTLTGRDQIAWRTDELRALRDRIAAESGRAPRKGAQAEQVQAEAAPPPSDDAVQRAADIVAAAWPAQGRRNACFLALAGACARGGVAQEVAADLAEAIYERLWPHHPDRHQARAEVRATYGKFAAGGEVTGFTTLSEFVGEVAAAEAMRALGAKPRLHVISGGREGEPDLLSQRPTDAGNAERLFALHGQDYLYVGDWGCFVVWDGARWIEDKRNLMLDRVRDTARTLYRQASRLEGDRRIEFAKLSARLESQSGAAGALKFAAAIQDSVVLSQDFDSDPFFLNCLNGVVDLRTGELRPHDRKDRMLKLAPVVYDPEASCPRWEQFLHEVFEPHPDVLPWIQKAIGYSFTGSVREQVFFLCWGRGCNGKGTLLNTLAEMLGDYGLAMDVRALADAQGRPDSPSEHIARLHGARFAKAEEPSDNFVMNESLIKWLTGDDLLRARRLYQNSFEFKPSHKIWLASNPKPVIKGTDVAIWRRVRFIPFEACFLGREDKALREKLRAEMPGVLRWAVEGAVRWYREGLGDCDTVAEATQAYRDECDQVSRFVTECCYVGPGASCKAKPLYQAYREWVTSGGEHTLSDKKFSARMIDRGFQKKHTETGTVYLGIGLLTGVEEAA
jgi:putative DNA primase/helicase